MLDVVSAEADGAADLLGPVGVRDDGQAARVRLVDDRTDLVLRHLVLVDQLDRVDAGLRELPHLGPRVVLTATPQRNSSVPGYGAC